MATTTTLNIDTIYGLEEDFTEDDAPFLLTLVQGVEGVSVPFSYDVTLFRSPSLPDVDVSKLINTRVAIGIKDKDNSWFRRRGVIASMAKTGTSNVRHTMQGNFFVYTAHIVPAFKMLDNEVTFRTFENMKISEIFKEVIHGFPGIPDSGYVNFGLLTAEEDETIDYYVQFGESSFNFLSRLMAQFGIWYMFDHRDTRELSVNETMVIGKSRILVQQCDQDQMNVVLYDPERDAIAQFSRAYTPAHHHVRVADFNEDDPTKPPKEPRGGGDRDILKAYDLQPGQPAKTSRFQLEQFPANSDADTLIRSEEYGVHLAQGQCQNRTFQAGRTFNIVKDYTGAAGTDSTYMVAVLSFAAYEHSHGHNVWRDLLNLLGDFTWKIFTPGDQKTPTWALSVCGSLSSQAFANYLQSEGPYALGSQTWTYKTQGDGGNGGATKPYFLNFAGGGLIAAGAGVLQNLFNGINNISQFHADQYSNTFVAIPYVDGTGGGWRMPLPSARSPTVNGVHLAVVVGSKGTDISQRGQIHSNGKGQVRVRFGWQRTVPATAQDATTDPLETDRRAAWVRVSEAWAGRQYGAQFLPRVGDEVVVSFIDGDPARPIITGRVYNDYAPHPFDPAAATQSGIKTQTTPKSYDAAERFHLIRFDDATGHEQLLFRSQDRLDVTALGTKYETIGGDSNQTVGWIDVKHTVVGGNHVAKVYQDYHLHVGDPAGPFNGGHRYEEVEQDYNLHIKKQTNFSLDGDWNVSVGGKASISADTIVLNAIKSITLVVGNSIVVVQADGIYNEAAIHYEQCGADGQNAAAAVLKPPKNPVQADNGLAKAAKRDG
jgi:uncharacterized protein involved in type VI secretion and phage assembly